MSTVRFHMCKYLLYLHAKVFRMKIIDVTEN